MTNDDRVMEWARSRSIKDWNDSIGEVARECISRPMTEMEARLLSMLRGISRDMLAIHYDISTISKSVMQLMWK
jgi:hypothetical protein